MVKEFLNKKIVCSIGKNEAVEGIIVKYEEWYYILNSITNVNNLRALDHYSKTYPTYTDAYCISYGRLMDLERNKVFNVRLLEPAYELW